MKIKAQFLLALFLGLASIISCDHSQTTDVKLMSYNIKHGVGNDNKLDLSRAAAIIKAQDPDIVGLQEIDHFTQRADSIDQTSYLAQNTNLTGTFGQFMNYQGGAYGMATLSKKPLISTKVLSLPDGLYEPRSSIVHEVELAEELTILFANVHFDWISGEDGQKSRSAQASSLIAYLDEFKLPTVITGDFNCTPDSPAMQLFYEAGFIFVEKGEDNLSFQGKNKVEIDHVIYRNTADIQFKVKSIDLLDEPLVSDHRPLVAEVEIIY